MVGVCYGKIFNKTIEAERLRSAVFIMMGPIGGQTDVGRLRMRLRWHPYIYRILVRRDGFLSCFLVAGGEDGLSGRLGGEWGTRWDRVHVQPVVL